MNKNLILLTDSYKISHYKQYPPQTEIVYSYLESRGGIFPGTVFFGLQYLLKEYFQGPVITHEKVAEAKEVLDQHLGPGVFNAKGWLRLLQKHEGFLPVSIKAVPEGMRINSHNVLMTIENTDPEFYWLTNYLETLLVQVWYPTTVATLSYYMKEMILDFLKRTGDEEGINFKLHDFGFRGVSSVESAAIGAAAHLINFQGTDTMAGLTMARDYYGAKMPGFSIPASEHSTITSWGREHELDAMRNMLEQYPKGLVACVSDSFDIYNACDNLWGKELKRVILDREGCLIIRPDSGYPPEVILKVLRILGKRFGYTMNKKGYKVLNPKVRVIQGDGIDYDMCQVILSTMELEGWSADNIAFGMGGKLLQGTNRDTMKFAFKCSAIQRKGEWIDVYKDPITDNGKMSKRGRLKLHRTDVKNFSTVAEKTPTTQDDILAEVFRDGHILKEYTFDDVRINAGM